MLYHLGHVGHATGSTPYDRGEHLFVQSWGRRVRDRSDDGRRPRHGSFAKNLVAVASSESPIAYSSSPVG